MKNQRTRDENIQRTKEEYQGAELNCDIVMKGGITSGIVYPLALCELAKTYSFKNIGGASAGAIGAVAAAAAEYGRTNGGTSYAELEELPAWFGIKPGGSKDSNLYHLFQPQNSTRRIFNLLIPVVLHQSGIWNKIIYIFGKSIQVYPVEAFTGALFGITALLLVIFNPADWLGSATAVAIFVIMSILILIAGICVSIGRRISSDFNKAIPDNFFGMCRGMNESGHGDAMALTAWLSELIDRLAGLDESSKPLTIGDLNRREINLLTITTNLTNAIPHTIPFNKEIYYFDPAEFRTLFPEKVVRWMEMHPRDDGKNRFGRKFKDRGLVPLPEADNLPVVFAARLSLSFPVLLSTVPLYAIDYTRVEDEKKVPEPCWFSDGGICSNFPIHFFDKPIPGWPTFAINLKEFHPDHPKSGDDSKNVWMPETNRGGTLASWHRFDDPKNYGMFAFIGAIKNAMMNWRDTTQMSVPGYRDRIVHVSVADDEGGLNMNMPESIIDSLSKRGQFAARKLVVAYTNPNPKHGRVSWDNHRWVRFRSTIPLVMENLTNLCGKLSGNIYAQGPGNRTYKDLIKDPPSYDWFSDKQYEVTMDAMCGLIKLVNCWLKNPYGGLDKNTPRPTPEIRILPKV